MAVNFLVFSDESGSWHSGDVYVRAWVKMSNEVHDNFEGIVANAKQQMGVKELKYDKFINNQQSFKCIFGFDFSVFITISNPAHFESRNYNILQTLNSIPTSMSTGGEELTNSIKKRVISAAKNTLFFEYFERYHMVTSRDALIGGGNPVDYQYFIDAPQCPHSDWEEIAKENDIANVKIVKHSEDYPGLELADIIAGCFRKKISGDNTAGQIYTECIKAKMCDLYSTSLPNPNLIFYKDFDDSMKRLCSGR